MEIRILQPGDEVALIAAAKQFNDVDMPDDRARTLLRDPTFVMIVARDERGELLGRIYGHELRRLDQTDFFLYEVDVEEADRRKGIGRAMFDAVRRLAIEKGYGETFVLTEVSNDAGNGLYRSAGSVLDGSPANVHVFPTPRE